MDSVSQFDKLLPLVEALIDDTSGRPVCEGEAWRSDGQVLAIKMCRHLISLRSIFNGASGYASAEESRDYVDHGSVAVLTRAALETYLAFHYVFCHADEKLREFRHCAWVLGGLCDRQKLHTLSDRFDEKLAQEAAKIERLRALLPSFAAFRSLTERQQANLLAGEWRTPHHWHHLALEAGMPRRLFKDIYTHLCNYAHSSYIAALQLRDGQNEGRDRWLATYPINVSILVMAAFVHSYELLFPAASRASSAHPSFPAAQMWRRVLLSMDEAYDRPSR